MDMILRFEGVHLVDDEEDGFVRTPQQLRNLLVQREDARPAIHHKENNIRLFDGNQSLSTHFRIQPIFWVGLKSPRIDKKQLRSVPSQALKLPVSSHTGPIVHNRLSLPHQAVEERRLPDIRATNNGDHWNHTRF